MLLVIFIITTVICAIGWFNRYVACTAVIYYIKKNQYKLPDSQEIKECTDYVLRNLFK